MSSNSHGRFYGFSDGKGFKSIAKVIPSELSGKIESVRDKKERLKKGDMHEEQLIDLVSSDNIDDLTQEVVIEDPNLELQPLMVLHDQNCPNRMYIVGQSYCGKTYQACKMAQDWVNVFPKSKVAYISFNEDDDKSCNDTNIENFVKLKISDEVVEDPISLDELHDKLVILDDIDGFSNPKIVKTLETLAKQCINQGRHKAIGTIICRQKLLDGHKSSFILNGVHQVLCFPHSGSRHQVRKYLDKYLSLPKKKIDKILNVPSRWVLINVCNPLYCVHARGEFIV
jgi:hypothetical protein